MKFLVCTSMNKQVERVEHLATVNSLEKNWKLSFLSLETIISIPLLIYFRKK